MDGDCREGGDASEGIQMEVSRGKGPEERCSTAIKTLTRREKAVSGLYFTLGIKIISEPLNQVVSTSYLLIVQDESGISSYFDYY